MTISAPTGNRLLWLLAGLVMLVEFLIFDRMTSLHHARIYPRWSDQIQYLTEAYTCYDALNEHGLWAGLKTALTNPAAQGTLHDVLAVPLFALVGPSRSAALSLNMLAFLVWQGALLFGIHRASGSRALGWVGFGLLPALAGPWSAGPGSAVDFRLDHAAMCLMGVTAITALLTRGFRSRPWSIIFGISMSVTLLERFLTGAYFAPIVVAIAIWIALTGERRTRWLNLGLAALTAFVLAGPEFWLNRNWILNYYWGGQFTGAESNARAPGLDHWDSLRFVVDGVIGLHLGTFLIWTVTAVTELLALGALLGNRRRFRWPDRDWLFTSLAFLTLPATVLCLHRQKSEYVLGVLIPGLLLLLLWVWTALIRCCETDIRKRVGLPMEATVALLVMLAGTGFFVVRQTTFAHPSGVVEANAQLSRFAERIYQASLTTDHAEPYVGFDHISDAYDGMVLRVMCYERHHVWIPLRVMLPVNILEVSESDLRDRLRRCHFYVLTEEMPGWGHWPYDRQMVKLRPFLLDWCQHNLVKTAEFQFFDRRMSLYERPEIPEI